MTQSSGRPSPAETITRAIIDRLEAGVRPWVRPWRSCAGQGRPLRADGEPYRGMNTFWLWLAAEQCGYRSRHWMTYRQAQSLGGQVRAGEQAQFAIFYKAYSKQVDSSERPGELVDEHRRVMRSYAVFNADQIDALPSNFYPEPLSLVPPGDRLDPRAQCFVDRLPARLRTGGDRAYYNLRADVITMPPVEQFDTRAAWAATLAHEGGHWTGHPDRLARSFGKRFGDQAYAFEELVAELTAALVGADVGLPTTHLDDHAAYIGSWLGILRRDNRALLTAAARAEEAAGYLLRATGLAHEDGAEERAAA